MTREEIAEIRCATCARVPSEYDFGGDPVPIGWRVLRREGRILAWCPDHTRDADAGAASARLVRRIQVKVPGFDCMHAPCAHKVKGAHGIGGGEYLYGLSDGEVALIIRFRAYEYPLTIPADIRARCIENLTSDPPSVDVYIHTAFPIARQVLVTSPPKDVCEFLDAVPCYYESAGYETEVSLWRDAGSVREFDRPEAFWKSFLDLFTRSAAKARAARVDTKWKLCPCCKGAQTVPLDAASC